MRKPALVTLTLVSLTLGVALIPGTVALAAPLEPAHDDLGDESIASKEVQRDIVTVDQWYLHQSSGRELYDGLCASCHGVAGAGHGPAARSQAVYPPPLDRLTSSGVDRAHWTYVIRARCEDSHHWGPHGVGTMPCWQRIFGQALANDAAPMLVSAKLADYLEEIQR